MNYGQPDGHAIENIPVYNNVSTRLPTASTTTDVVIFNNSFFNFIFLGRYQDVN